MGWKSPGGEVCGCPRAVRAAEPALPRGVAPAGVAMGCGLRKLDDPEDSSPGKIFSTLKRPQVETKTEVAYEYVLLDFTLQGTFPSYCIRSVSCFRDEGLLGFLCKCPFVMFEVFFLIGLYNHSDKNALSLNYIWKEFFYFALLFFGNICAL